MSLPERGSMLLGHTLLHWRRFEPRNEGELPVDVAPAATRLEQWIADGGLLGVQALNPLATWPERERHTLSLLAEGPGAALPALCASAFGFRRVVAVLPAEQDRAAFLAAARGHGAGDEASALEDLEQVPWQRQFQRCLLGCGGVVPPAGAVAPLIARMRTEGQLTLFGLPEGSLLETFRDLADRGMALSASGFRGKQAYLSGALERPLSFLP